MRTWQYLLPLTLIGLSACGGKEPELPAASANTNSKALPVQVAPVSRENVQLSVIASGIVAAEGEARVSFKTGGILLQTLAEEGQSVKKGQLLATLDMREIDAQVQQAEEGLAKAQRDFDRVKNLYADSVATLEQFQNASTGLEVAQKNAEIARFNRQFSEIRSPISGKVIKKMANEGEVVGPGMPVYYLLSDLSQDWVVRVGLTDRDWARLREGDRASVRLDAYPGVDFQARINRLADVANPQNGSFEAELQLNPAGKRMASGLVASVEIFPEKTGELAVIPIEALVESNGNQAVVFVLQPNGTVRRQPVVIAFLKGAQAAIASGLEQAEKVVTTGAPYLEDGQLVYIQQ